VIDIFCLCLLGSVTWIFHSKAFQHVWLTFSRLTGYGSTLRHWFAVSVFFVIAIVSVLGRSCYFVVSFLTLCAVLVERGPRVFPETSHQQGLVCCDNGYWWGQLTIAFLAFLYCVKICWQTLTCSWNTLWSMKKCAHL